MSYLKLQAKFKKVLLKVIPIWLVLILIFQTSLLTGFFEYLIMKRNFNRQLVELLKNTKSPEDLVQILKQEVLPQSGHTLSVRWNDIGKELLSSGAIDKAKFEQLFAKEPESLNQMKYLLGNSKDNMVINEKNSHFMVNTLWALGLVNKNRILDEGKMKSYGNGDPMSFASTGGWTLGAKQTDALYSSTSIIKLTDKQQKLVEEIASDIYRPCCGNPTSFPDCNHGMAALGYIELAVKQGVPKEQIYKDVLALNSFWFPQNYIEIAAFFNKQAKDWKSIDPKLILSQQYSSGEGAQRVKQSVSDIPGLKVKEGGCGA